MQTGRKPLPTAVKRANGNPGKRRLNSKEAEPSMARPIPPSHLSEEAEIEWERVSRELAAAGLLSLVDRSALAAYCQAYGRWVQAEAALQKMKNEANGLVVKTKSGNIIQNPLVGVANKAMADVVRYAAEFGMTPSARSRIEVGGSTLGAPQTAADEFLN
jgi:P27 family predicted phage terminase small subunit